MGRGRKSKDEAPEMDTQGWLTTFADLVMLLLTFFVLLLTMSSMDTKTLRKSFSQFHGAPGVLELGSNQSISPLANFIKYYSASEHLMVVDHELMRKLLLPSWSKEKPPGAKEDLLALDTLANIEDIDVGIAVSFSGDMIFNPGRGFNRILIIIRLY